MALINFKSSLLIFYVQILGILAALNEFRTMSRVFYTQSHEDENIISKSWITDMAKEQKLEKEDPVCKENSAKHL